MAEPPNESAPQPGDVLCGYRLLERVGQGGVAWVFRGESVDEPGRVRALKVLRSAADEARLRREARALQSLQHAGFVRADGVFRCSGWIALTMEFVAGRTLARVGRHPDAFAIVDRVADALAAMHAERMVHRDLTPNNVMLADAAGGAGDAPVRVIDLGLVRWLDRSPGDGDDSLSRGVAIGTREFMPPEVYDAFADMGPASDVFSLAGTLYFLLEGRPPFPADTRSMDMPFPVPEHVPPPLRELFERATRFQPGDRYQTIADFRAQLARCRSGSPMTTTHPTRPFQRAERKAADPQAARWEKFTRGTDHLFVGGDVVEARLSHCEQLDGLADFDGARFQVDWVAQVLRLWCECYVTLTSAAPQAADAARVVQDLFAPGEAIVCRWGQRVELAFRRRHGRALFACVVEWPRDAALAASMQIEPDVVAMSFSSLRDGPQALCRVLLGRQATSGR